MSMADVIDMKTRRKEQRASDDREDLLQAADEFLDRHGLRYVLGLACYFLKTSGASGSRPSRQR